MPLEEDLSAAVGFLVHAGVIGNIEADRLANEARQQPPINIQLPAEDALRVVKRRYGDAGMTNVFLSGCEATRSKIRTA